MQKIKAHRKTTFTLPLEGSDNGPGKEGAAPGPIPGKPFLKPKRIIGIDYGLKRIGLAISDEKQMIAFPWKTQLAKRKVELTAKELAQLISEHSEKLNCEVAEIVVGMPLMMSGCIGHLADEVTVFVDRLKKNLTIPVITWDERLSTVQANRSLQGLSRKKRSAVVDEAAAVIILQSYLDSKG